MKRELRKDIINKKLDDMWGSIVTAAGVPEELHNIAVEYCDYHATIESKDVQSPGFGDTVSTLTLAIDILSRLNLSNVEHLYIDDETPDVSYGWKMDELVEEVKDGAILDENMVSAICEKVVIEEVSKDINIRLEGKKNLTIGILARSVSLIAEKSFAPRLLFVLQFSVE